MNSKPDTHSQEHLDLVVLFGSNLVMRRLPAGNRDAPAHCPLVCRVVHRRCVAPRGIFMGPPREANRQRNGHAAVLTSVGCAG